MDIAVGCNHAHPRCDGKFATKRHASRVCDQPTSLHDDERPCRDIGHPQIPTKVDKNIQNVCAT